MDKVCLACGETINGRSDKKFCDAHCRNMYHNNHKPDHEQHIQTCNASLRKNRRLLAQFCPGGKTTVKKAVLANLGYSFHHFTNIFPFSTGVYYFCYDYGYLPIIEKGEDKMLIVQKQDYMSSANYNPWDIKIINR